MADFEMIVPAEITDSMTSTSNISNVYSDWLVGTTYNTGDTIVYNISGEKDYRYESLTDSNTGNIPLGDTVNWNNVGAANKWRYRDGKTETFSTRNDDIEFIINTKENLIDSIALLGVDADTVRLVLEANVRINKLTNGNIDETEDIHGWSDISVGTPDPVWGAYVAAQLEYVDASNYAALSQAVSGTSGKKRTITSVMNPLSTANFNIDINGVTVLSLSGGATPVTATFISDGSDLVEVYPTGVGTTYFSEAQMYEVSEENLILNGGFETDIDDWTDESTGTGTVTWDASINGSLKLTRVDSSNIGRAEQSVVGVSGKKYKYVVKNDTSSTGSVSYFVNGVQLGVIAPGDEESGVAISDGDDLFALKAQTNASTVYVDYAIQTLYTQYDETIDTTDVSTVIRKDLPVYQTTQITTTLTKYGAVVSLGEMVIGSIKTFGSFRGSSITMKSYATKATDTTTQITTFTAGDYSRIIDYRVGVELDDVESCLQALEDNGNTAIVAIGDETYPQTIVYGFINGFFANLDGLVKNDFTIKVEELT